MHIRVLYIIRKHSWLNYQRAKTFLECTEAAYSEIWINIHVHFISYHEAEIVSKRLCYFVIERKIHIYIHVYDWTYLLAFLCNLLMHCPESILFMVKHDVNINSLVSPFPILTYKTSNQLRKEISPLLLLCMPLFSCVTLFEWYRVKQKIAIFHTKHVDIWQVTDLHILRMNHFS